MPAAGYWVLEHVATTDVMTLNESFEISDFNWNKRFTDSPVAFSHGTRDISDNKLDGRVIELNGNVFPTPTGTLYIDQMDELDRFAFQDTFKLYWLTNTATWYINIKKINKETTPSEPSLQNIVADVNLRCLAEDPFWYSSDVTTFSTVVTSGDTAVATLSNSVELIPVVTIINSSGASNGDFVIKNATAGGGFRIRDTGFQTSHTIVIDPTTGDVVRESLGILNRFTGGFLPLAQGGNSITYTGATSLALFLTYRKRTLYPPVGDD